jgi:hypothetical protein
LSFRICLHRDRDSLMDQDDAFRIPATEQAAILRLLTSALPPGWVVLGQCRQGGLGPAPQPTGCHVLAHAGIGITLLDMAPHTTPNAEARMRRMLAAADFGDRFTGTLPIWHGRIEPGQLHRLPTLLDQAFATLPPATLPGGGAWLGAVREALDADPAWEATGRSKRPAAPLPDPAFLDEEDPPAPRPGRAAAGSRRLLVGLAFAGVFALGLGAGAILTTAQEETGPGGRAPPSADASGQAAPAAAGAGTVATAPPVQAGPPRAAAAPPVDPPERPAPEMRAAAAPAPAPPEPAAARPRPEPRADGAGAPAGLPMAAPPAATTPEPIRTVAPAPPLDPPAPIQAAAPEAPPPAAAVGRSPPPPLEAPPAASVAAGSVLGAWGAGGGPSPQAPAGAGGSVATGAEARGPVATGPASGDPVYSFAAVPAAAREAEGAAAATATPEPDLPLPPAAIAQRPPPPPPRPAARALSYDRRCGDALFRWQQGARLTAAEMAFVRDGCVAAAARR